MIPRSPADVLVPYVTDGYPAGPQSGRAAHCAAGRAVTVRSDGDFRFRSEYRTGSAERRVNSPCASECIRGRCSAASR
eukprot:763943-Hanusia_phi.AAC.1